MDMSAYGVIWGHMAEPGGQGVLPNFTTDHQTSPRIRAQVHPPKKLVVGSWNLVMVESWNSRNLETWSRQAG